MSLVEARKRLQQTESGCELRIGNLESKINELCSIIATYESNSANKETTNNSNKK